MLLRFVSQMGELSCTLGLYLYPNECFLWGKIHCITNNINHKLCLISTVQVFYRYFLASSVCRDETLVYFESNLNLFFQVEIFQASAQLTSIFETRAAQLVHLTINKLSC